MNYLEQFWATYPKLFGETEFLKQVGSTVNGKPIPERQFQLIVSEITQLLSLEKEDRLLDLGCGNGLITRELAKTCRNVVGIDFSEPLLDIANRFNRPHNVIFRRMSLLELDKMPQLTSKPFNKILMYGVLQAIGKRDLAPTLRNILRVSSDNRVILIGSVIDKRRKWKFFNTPRKVLNHLSRRITGRETLCTWWEQGFIERTCRDLGLRCNFHEQNGQLYTAHYRFDVTICA
jgi:cyclopropane fatty-acyl-phospholipid synthase-like methyltransferase